jgi:hypothetical protein
MLSARSLPGTPARTFSPLFTALAAYYASAAIVFLAIAIGDSSFREEGAARAGIEASCFKSDAGHYWSICERGYSYSPDRRSEVAFFPAYPLLARFLAWLTGWQPPHALLILSNVFLLGCFLLWPRYLRARDPIRHGTLSHYVMLAFALFPTTLFFRMPYSESLFILSTLAALLGMTLRWPDWLLAIVVGFSTATRPVGIAVLLVFILFLWQTSASPQRFLLRLATLGPLACWGLLAFMLYQYAMFGDPFGFIKTQTYWRTQQQASIGTKLYSLATLEPIWAMFHSSSSRYWANFDTRLPALVSPVVANAVIFVVAAALIALGIIKQWLNSQESMLGVLLLLIPYLTRAYDNSMFSMGRFAAAAVPIYLVLGQLLSRSPRLFTAAVLLGSAAYLAIFSALYAGGFPVF